MAGTKVMLRVQDVNIVGANMVINVAVHFVPNGIREGTSFTVPHTNVDTTNFVSGIKTQVINYVQNKFGAVILPTEILVFEAPQ